MTTEDSNREPTPEVPGGPQHPPAAGPLPEPQPTAQPAAPSKSKSRVLAIAVIAGALLAGAVFAVFMLGDDGDAAAIRTEQGAVDNAEEFLDLVQSQWQRDLPTTNVTVSETAACYYQLDNDDLVTGRIACGGVRRAGASDGHVWDLATFDLFEVERGRHAGNETFVERGVPRPPGRLVTSQGAEPAEDEDALEAPPLPQAESGLLTTEIGPNTLDLVDPLKPDDVITPGGVLRFESIASTDVIPTNVTDENPAGVFAPATGEEFVVYQLGFTEGAVGSFDRPDLPGATLLLSAGGRQTEIAQLSGNSQFTVVVSIPTDDDEASLIVSSASHDQHVDARTGERRADGVADTLYRPITTQSLTDLLSFDTQVVSDGPGFIRDEPQEYQIHIEVTDVDLRPYLYDDDGGAMWAEPGTAFLVVNQKLSIDQPEDCRVYVQGVTHEWEVIGVDGASDLVDQGDDIRRPILVVPADIEDVTIQVTVSSRTIGDPDGFCGGVAWPLEFGTQSFEVSFPND